MISAVLLAEPIGLVPAAALAACGLASAVSACRHIARAIRGTA